MFQIIVIYFLYVIKKVLTYSYIRHMNTYFAKYAQKSNVKCANYIFGTVFPCKYHLKVK